MQSEYKTDTKVVSPRPETKRRQRGSESVYAYYQLLFDKSVFLFSSIGRER